MCQQERAADSSISEKEQERNVSRRLWLEDQRLARSVTT
jgi:hypothetical protein